MLWDSALGRNQANFTAGASKSVYLKIDQATRQITNVILPNGTELTTSNKLDNNKDQIVRVNYKITGAAKHSGCEFKGMNVSNR